MDGQEQRKESREEMARIGNNAKEAKTESQAKVKERKAIPARKDETMEQAKRER